MLAIPDIRTLWLLIKALKLLNDQNFEISQKIEQIERAYTIQIIICR